MAGTRWQIDRFDLIYYNPRHKRWQFFAEDPASNADTPRDPHEGLHRYLFRALLNTFRNAVSQTVKITGGEFGLSSRPSSGLEEKLRLAHPPADHPSFEVWQDYKAVFLDYLVSTAWYDGVLDAHRQKLQEWFANADTELSRAEALTFLSLLPILEDWDTWGCFIRARNQGERTAHAFPPPCAKEWAEPFYIVNLDFSQTDDARRSKELLGYQVQIEGLCLNLAEPMPSIHRAPKADFFDVRFCKTPTGEEQTTYSLYAALVDEIMKQLTGEEVLRQFIVAYPVVAAGRLHFLQIALRHFGEGCSCVDCLWNSWQPAHRSLWTPTFRDFLQEEMHRITTAAFQGEVYAHLAGSIKDKGANPDQTACQDELCAHIYHLFPVDSVWPKSGGWTYDEYPFRDRSATQLLVGKRWIFDGTATAPRNRDLIEIDGIRIKPADAPRDRTAKLARGHRIRQAIRQQQHFLTWLPEGLKAAKDAAAEDQQSAYEIVSEWAKQHRLEHVQTSEVLDSPATTQLPQPTGRIPYCARWAPNSLRRYLAEAFPNDQQYDDILISRLRSLMQPSILLELSELFETGPARLAVHLGEYASFSGSLVDLQNSWSSHYAPLAAKLAGEVAAFGINSQPFIAMIKLLEQKLTNCKKLADIDPDPYVQDPIIDAVAKLRIEPRNLFSHALDPNKAAFRCHVVDPITVLAPFFTGLKNNRTKGLANRGHYTRQLRMSGPSPLYGSKPEQADYPVVKRVDHYLVFPFRTPPQVDEFCGSQICQAWSTCCQRVASLYFYTATRTWELRRVTEDKIEKIVETAAHATFTNDRLKVNSLVVSFGVWRAVESATLLQRWSEQYPSVDLPLTY